MEDKTGGPAFPFDTKPVHTTDGNDVILTNIGMTLLDYFAGAALPDAMRELYGSGYEAIAKTSYDMARAMLKERAKEAGK